MEYKKKVPKKKSMNKFIYIVLFAVLIEVIGTILNWHYYFGVDNQYLFVPHNDIFHLIALYMMITLQKNIKKK